MYPNPRCTLLLYAVNYRQNTCLLAASVTAVGVIGMRKSVNWINVYFAFILVLTLPVTVAGSKRSS